MPVVRRGRPHLNLQLPLTKLSHARPPRISLPLPPTSSTAAATQFNWFIFLRAYLSRRSRQDSSSRKRQWRNSLQSPPQGNLRNLRFENHHDKSNSNFRSQLDTEMEILRRTTHLTWSNATASSKSIGRVWYSHGVYGFRNLRECSQIGRSFL
ncbi:hypothetical protein F8388_012860 [Cannabis sativa]|uniref:Uncharacterized protein n=1 Tax=Cannabis sativa TaxID=3483 RepID=A0A7J6EUP7_CANSA|nr:hypothetical protein F8388_012860 [Cannabis sativa]